MTTHRELEAWNSAAKDHAGLLYLEGYKLREIAERLGISRSTAHQKVHWFARRLNRAMRRTRVYVVQTEETDK